jgi:hypothetical protein
MGEQKSFQIVCHLEDTSDEQLRQAANRKSYQLLIFVRNSIFE